MEGFVTRIIDEQMIGVTGEDDFEIPVLASKVTTVHGYVPAGAVKEDKAEEPEPIGEFKTSGVYLAVINDAKANSVVHFHLVNDTSFHVLATLTTNGQNKFKEEYAGVIAPKSAEKIYSAQMADLQLWPKFVFNIIFSAKQNVAPPVPLVVEEKFKAKDFAGSKKQAPILKQACWLIQLDQPEVMIDAEKLKESFFTTTEEKTTIEKPGKEVDLHIEKIRNDHQFISSHEILKIQLDYFHKALDSAIVYQLPEIIFIHGAGNGTLRQEIQKVVSKHPKVQTFMDAQKEKFGYGATKVILK
jgi:hypothetical protein